MESGWFGLVVGHILTNSTFWMKPKTSGPLISSSNRRKTKQNKNMFVFIDSIHKQ